MGYGRPINIAESKDIISSYLEGESTIKLGKRLGRRPSTIRNHLVLKGVGLRPSNVRVYMLDDAYFDSLEDEGPAYWLGALTADGCISGNRVHLDCKESDIEWLTQFKHALCYTGPVYTYDRCDNSYSSKKKSVLSFTSKKIQSKLIDYGFTHNKTDEARFCEQVPTQLVRHYIRGLIDGDGSLYKLKNGSFGINFVGTRDLVEGVANHLSMQLDIYVGVNPHKSIYSWAICGKEKPKIVVDYLYQGSHFHMERKKKIAIEISELQVNRANRSFKKERKCHTKKSKPGLRVSYV